MAGAAYSQEPQDPAKDTVVSELAAAPKPEQKKVTAIEIQGSRFISSAVVLSKIKTRIGADYSTNIISDDIKRLNELGYFSDIKIDAQDFEGGLKVFIIVTEKNLIGKIVFEGYFSRGSGRKNCARPLVQGRPVSG